MAGLTIKKLTNADTQRWVQITRNDDMKEWTFAIGDIGTLVAYDTARFRFGNQMSSWSTALMHAEWMSKHC